MPRVKLTAEQKKARLGARQAKLEKDIKKANDQFEKCQKTYSKRQDQIVKATGALGQGKLRLPVKRALKKPVPPPKPRKKRVFPNKPLPAVPRKKPVPPPKPISPEASKFPFLDADERKKAGVLKRKQTIARKRASKKPLTKVVRRAK
jgi:hypothetical protein